MVEKRKGRRPIQSPEFDANSAVRTPPTLLPPSFPAAHPQGRFDAFVPELLRLYYDPLYRHSVGALRPPSLTLRLDGSALAYDTAAATLLGPL